jgi:hypothetical protein
LGGHGANNHSTCQHGEDRYKYYQQFKFHIDGPLGIRICLKAKIYSTQLTLTQLRRSPDTVAKLIDN